MSIFGGATHTFYDMFDHGLKTINYAER